MENSEIIRQIKMMLGGPVIDIELSDEQINEAIVVAKEDFEFFSSILSEDDRKLNLKIQNTWIKRYTLAICKEMLGRIRGKLSEIPIPGGGVHLDGNILCREAKMEKNFLFRMCVNHSLEQFVLLNKRAI